MYCPKFCTKSTESAVRDSSYYAFANCQYHSLVSCTAFVLHNQGAHVLDWDFSYSCTSSALFQAVCWFSIMKPGASCLL
jgi:hypothetical protein